MIKQKIYIIGCEGTALNIIEQVTDAREKHGMTFNLVGILIDSYNKGDRIAGLPVAGCLTDIPGMLRDESCRFIFALYKPVRMKERHELLLNLGIPIDRFVNFIHPLAFVAGSVNMGNGNVILSNSNIMSGVKLGSYNIINAGVTIEHDSIIGDSCFFASGSVIGARVKTGNHCFIGLNSSVREDVTLGNNVFAGMHSLVLNEFSDCRIAGVPAKII